MKLELIKSSQWEKLKNMSMLSQIRAMVTLLEQGDLAQACSVFTYPKQTFSDTSHDPCVNQQKYLKRKNVI